MSAATGKMPGNRRGVQSYRPAWQQGKIILRALAGGTFRDRYRNHVKSTKHEKYKNETQLSKYIWNLKKTNNKYTLAWDIVKKSNLNVRKSGLCNLCLEEKYTIIYNKDALNKRSELISKCRHRNRPARKPPERQSDPPHRAESQKSQSACRIALRKGRETAGSGLRALKVHL